eukprot:3118447-Rhodomonas_salina.1
MAQGKVRTVRGMSRQHRGSAGEGADSEGEEQTAQGKVDSEGNEQTAQGKVVRTVRGMSRQHRGLSPRQERLKSTMHTRE